MLGAVFQEAVAIPFEQRQIPTIGDAEASLRVRRREFARAVEHLNLTGRDPCEVLQ